MRSKDVLSDSARYFARSSSFSSANPLTFDRFIYEKHLFLASSSRKVYSQNSVSCASPILLRKKKLFFSSQRYTKWFMNSMMMNGKMTATTTGMKTTSTITNCFEGLSAPLFFFLF